MSWLSKLHPRLPKGLHGGRFVKKHGDGGGDGGTQWDGKGAGPSRGEPGYDESWVRRISDDAGRRHGVQFEEHKAKTYHPSAEVKHAEVVDAPAGHKTTIKAEWGEDQSFVGPWVRVVDPETGETKYGSAHKEWMDMHSRVPGVENGWQKTATVDAYQHTGPDSHFTTVLADGTVETKNSVTAGDWIVRQKHGEVQIIKDAKFRKLYQVH